MNDTLIEEPAGTFRENFPSRSVIVPKELLPTTITDAPMTGTFWPSTTVPLMERFCAKAWPEHKENAAATKTEAVTFKNSFNIGFIG